MGEGGRSRRTTRGVMAVLVCAGALAVACTGTTTTTTPSGGTSGAGATPPGTPAPAPDPSRRGPNPVGYLELSVTDPSRDRTLPVSVWYPAAAAGTVRAGYGIIGNFVVPAKDVWKSVPVAPGRHPLIVFSHGNGGTRFQSWFITESLASHGFIVVSPDHVGNTLNDKQTVDSVTRAAADRPKDIPVLIDDLLRRNGDPADPLHDTIDPDHIGMSGHSYGGYTTLAAAGGSGFGDPPDARIKAIAPLAPAASIIPEDKLRAVTVPTLLMGGSIDRTTPAATEVSRTYDLISAPIKYRVVITDGNHNTYTITCGAADLLGDPAVPKDLATLARDYMAKSCGPEVIPYDQAARIIDRYLVSFFSWQLRGDDRYRAFMTPVDRVVFAGQDHA